jgi:N-formylglutamate deformylase
MARTTNRAREAMMTRMSTAFRVLDPIGMPRPIVGHVPHAATRIPPRERAGLHLDDAGLVAELARLTDAHTDRLYGWIREIGGVMVVNGVSRLVVDPERFPDDEEEPMAAAGQGAVYTHTTAGAPLRHADPGERRRLMDRWYWPYHRTLEAIVAGMLERFGTCLILDAHSFSSVPLPSEADQDPGRPEVCLGTDPLHTPAPLVAGLARTLRAEGFEVAIDRPFAGALVPLRWYGTDQRVASLMIETRRNVYMDETTGAPGAAFDAVSARLARAVTGVLGD